MAHTAAADYLQISQRFITQVFMIAEASYLSSSHYLHTNPMPEPRNYIYSQPRPLWLCSARHHPKPPHPAHQTPPPYICLGYPYNCALGHC